MSKAVKMKARAVQAASNAGFIPAKKRSAVASLPFVGLRTTTRDKGNLPNDYWHNVKSTGDHVKDSEIGGQLAYLALQAIKAENFAPALGWIVLDMIGNKCPEHIVVGFFQTVADVCLGYHKIPAGDVRLVNPLAIRAVK